MIARALRTFRRSQGANAAIEFALIVPLMLTFMAGIVELGHAYQAYRSVNRLATRYAITWADCSDYPTGTCQTQMNSWYAPNTAMRNLEPQLTNAISLRMFQVKMSGTTPSITYAYPTGTSALSTPETTAAAAAIASGQTGVIVTVSYPYTLVFFQTLASPFFKNGLPTMSFSVAQDKS